MANTASITSGAALVALVASLGCMGTTGVPGLFSAGTASKSPAVTGPSFADASASSGARQFGGANDSSGSGISQALWNNPVSRAVKNAFSGDVVPAEYAAAGAISSDPISLSHPKKPPTPGLYIAMGQVAEQSGDREKARMFYQQALSIAPKSADALAAYGRFEDRQGRLGEAARLYREALAADPKHAGAYNDLGLCLARQGQFPQALEMLQQAVRLNPDRPVYRNNLARVLVETGRTQDAVTELAAVFPPADAYYNVGWFLTQSGRNDEAAAHFAASLQHDPGMHQARAWLAKLQLSAVGALPAQAGQGQVTRLGTGGDAYAGLAAQQQQQQPGGVAANLPVITNVRSAATTQPTNVASLPRGNAATWQPNTASAPAGDTRWTPNPQQSAWPPSQGDRYATGGPQDPYQMPDHYQTSPAAKQPAAPTGLEALLQAPVQRNQPAPFDGQSHDSPWGNIPSPYQGSQLAPAGNSTMQYPESVAVANGNVALQNAGTPTTVVNPYVSGAPYGAYGQSQVQQASGAQAVYQ